MSADFTRHLAMGNPVPTRFEVDLDDCEMTGALPTGFNGAFYRMHLDWLYPPSFEDDTLLAADGYMSMFRFKDGRAHYKGRYVRTQRYLKQREAGRQLYGYYRNPYTDDASVRDIANPNKRTTANTTAVILGGRLYATKEDGLPYEIDPNTLATRTQTDFDGAWKSQTFTAHPKFDPVTGETYGYATKRPASARAMCSCVVSIAPEISRSSGASRRRTRACCMTCGLPGSRS